MKRAKSLQELQVELDEQIGYTAHQEFTARVLLFIAERLSEMDRVPRLQQDVDSLRELIQTVRKEAATDSEEARKIAYELMPKIKDGHLVFEADDGQGSTVDCRVQFEALTTVQGKEQG